ncbi:MAG TPA: putative nucleotidyltransferase substrate binding domain-containing protein [Solirubrobacteraceae bacterium]|nr:putative nucleotidyltransferase substrate binding domain-containing protein [Solirubrobacteraceae bacterium]
MSATAAPEVTRFLHEHPPFDALDDDDVERVAAAAEVEFHRAGETIFSQGAEPVSHLRVVRAGAVEIVFDGRVLDLLGEGELFGHASMLSGLPTGFEARAGEDTVCYRIPAEVAQEPLSRPAGLRFVARSLLDIRYEGGAAVATEPGVDPPLQPAGSLVRGDPVVCRPDTSIREAAELMTAAHATCVVIDLGDGSLGILTDRDLRTRVVACGLAGDTPVSAAMSTPAYTCPPDRLGGDVLLDMLDRGFRHYPVVSATGTILGVIEEIDLVAAQTRSSFYLRRRIARAQTLDELIDASRELRPTVIAMHDAHVGAANVSAVYSVVVDALTRRLLELSVLESGELGVEFAWLALGSQARREAVPSSDVDSAIVWFGASGDDAAVKSGLNALAKTVVARLEACGLHADEHGATASDPRFVRSLDSWQRAARSLIDDPTQEKALLLVSVLVDSRPVWGIHTGTPVADTVRFAPSNPALLRLLARFALSHRPPTGFFRGLVVEPTGEHRGRLDLKHRGVLPIVDLARWAGIAAGVTSASTSERLRAAAAAGTLSETHARTLQDALTLITDLRVAHQVDQLRAREEPDDFVKPAELTRLTRSYLREAFRAVASVQKRVAAELKVGVR